MFQLLPTVTWIPTSQLDSARPCLILILPPLPPLSHAFPSPFRARGIAFGVDRLVDLNKLDPWLPLAWPAHPSSSLIEMPLERVRANYYYDLTDMPHSPFGGGGEMLFEEVEMDVAAGAVMAMARAPEDDEALMKRSKSAEGGDAAGGRQPVSFRVRSHFAPTALFLPSLEIGPSGEAHVHWALPDNSGAYELRAYASTQQRVGGGVRVEQRVRKMITLQPSSPRIARVGDRFRAGVTITASPELPEGSRVRGWLRLLEPVKGEHLLVLQGEPDACLLPSCYDLSST